MRHSYLLAGIASGDLYKLISRNGFSKNLTTIPRVAFLAQSSVWSSFFKRRQKQKFGHELKKYQMPADPIFIVGHWRTGSTLLHQLMALDENLVAPNVFQVSCPESFLVSEKFYKPVMSSMMGKTRPMDNVKLGFYEPQEDEYALLKMGFQSPLEKLIFAGDDQFFLSGYNDFLPPKDIEEKWIAKFDDFCKALSFSENKRVLLKNPFHSMRLPLLMKQYPRAKFIHIHRHPYQVVQSTINMWNVVGSENYLKQKPPKINLEDVVEVMDKMLAHIHKYFEEIPASFKAEIRFEDFEKDPLNVLKNVYSELDIRPAESFDSKVKSKLMELKSYKKNKYEISSIEKEFVSKTLKKHFIYYNYTD